MNPQMQKELDAAMDGYALARGSASHPSDPEKRRAFFVGWYERDGSLAVADWEQCLIERGREWDNRCVVLEMPEDVAIVARHFGHK